MCIEYYNSAFKFADGVKIYRRSLRDSRHEKPEVVQQKIRIRSRQQRVSIAPVKYACTVSPVHVAV